MDSDTSLQIVKIGRDMAYKRIISLISNNSVWVVGAWLQRSGIQETDFG